MTNKQQGFTLIELVAVIVILGALAVVALPRFVNLQDEAQQAGAEGVAGALGSGSAVNFAAVLASDNAGDFAAVTSCAETPDTLQSGGMPNGYSVNTTGTATGATGETFGESFTCNVQSLDNLDASATFNAIYVSTGDFS